MSDQAILRIEAVEKRFGAVRAVDGVSLEVGRREFFALLGPSGSGKTTLLRIVSGLEAPDRGRVEIGGTDVTRLPPYLRRIGMVFQDFLLFPHRTVAENITFPLKMQGRNAAEREEQLDWILGFVRMEGLGGPLPPSAFRRAEATRSRVALARGLVSRPELLLLDEPLANLDRELRKEMEIEVRRYQEELGIPFVYVTHNQEEALTMSDRMAVMHQGVLEQIGPKLEVYNAPATRFVASFVGAPNKLSGRVIEGEGRGRAPPHRLGRHHADRPLRQRCPAGRSGGDLSQERTDRAQGLGRWHPSREPDRRDGARHHLQGSVRRLHRARR